MKWKGAVTYLNDWTWGSEATLKQRAAHLLRVFVVGLGRTRIAYLTGGALRACDALVADLAGGLLGVLDLVMFDLLVVGLLACSGAGAGSTGGASGSARAARRTSGLA